MTAACDCCKLADARPDYPRIGKGCRACAIRKLANSPLFNPSGVDGSLSLAYRKELASIDGDNWRALHDEVKVVAKRKKEQGALL